MTDQKHAIIRGVIWLAVVRYNLSQTNAIERKAAFQRIKTEVIAVGAALVLVLFSLDWRECHKPKINFS